MYCYHHYEHHHHQPHYNHHYHHYVILGPLQGTYDKIVSNTLNLLRGMSLDERASRLREQYKAREVRLL
jgi:hypothetical protein